MSLFTTNGGLLSLSLSVLWSNARAGQCSKADIQPTLSDSALSRAGDCIFEWGESRRWKVETKNCRSRYPDFRWPVSSRLIRMKTKSFYCFSISSTVPWSQMRAYPRSHACDTGTWRWSLLSDQEGWSEIGWKLLKPTEQRLLIEWVIVNCF